MLGFAVTGAARMGSVLMASLTIAAAAGGPALASLTAVALGARAAVAIAAGLVGLAVPAALALTLTDQARGPASQRAASKQHQLAAGFAEIARRPALLRATVTSSVSYIGVGMLLVCCPLLCAAAVFGRVGRSSPRLGEPGDRETGDR